LAGGGPENVLLVVNPKSPTSLAIANHYAQLRQISPVNLVFLPWNPKFDTTDVDTFRRQILVPILKTIESRNLTEQIDYVAYSSDFPWAISLDSDFRRFTEEMQHAVAALETSTGGKPGAKPDEKRPAAPAQLPPMYKPVGSLSGMTYLWQPVLKGHPDYLALDSNGYARRPSAKQDIAAAAAFRANRQYDRSGNVISSGGRRYLLAMMLGVTAGRGNSPRRVLDYLRRSAQADGTQPRGTIYFLKNDDVRSTVRDPLFPAAVEELKRLGVAAEILQGTVPLKRDDVQGLVMGTSDFDWQASGSTILPGAICDNFTSFGGVMTQGASQTPLSVFLRFGAAGASGTVVEPYAIANKFPTPMLQVYYAGGCTLAEAFYQAVLGPYQLLIVGDPLCRPWAKIPRVSVTGVKSGTVVRGSQAIHPSATLPGGAAVDRFELFVDGVRWAACKPGGELPLHTASLADGYHELRIVAVAPPPIESQGRVIIPIEVNNHEGKIEAALATPTPLRADRPVTIKARSPGAKGIVVIHGARVVAQIAGQEGELQVPADTLGPGPVVLRVAGLGGGGPSTCVVAKPLEFTLQ
jgi:uncharacterized protein (TIGR03790 family)